MAKQTYKSKFAITESHIFRGNGTKLEAGNEKKKSPT